MDIDEILINILKYLDITELFRISNVNKKFYNIIMCQKIDSTAEKYETEIYDYIDLIYSEPDELPQNSDKIISFITNNKYLKKISLILCENIYLARKILSEVISKNVKELYIPLAMIKSSNDFEKFNESLTELTIKNMYFNEVGMEFNVVMVENILKLKNLKKLK